MKGESAESAIGGLDECHGGVYRGDGLERQRTARTTLQSTPSPALFTAITEHIEERNPLVLPAWTKLLAGRYGFMLCRRQGRTPTAGSPTASTQELAVHGPPARPPPSRAEGPGREPEFRA